MEREKSDTGYRTSRTERASYSLFFFGQNVFYGLVAINMQTFFSDTGITVASIAAILLVTKLWDAVNDPLIGMLIDRSRFKKGRFLPWMKISVPAIAVSSLFFFFLPSAGGAVLKTIWAIVAYAAWDMSYTFCDVPIFVLPTSMTDNIKERGQMLTMGRFIAILGVTASAMAIPMLQSRIGWVGCGILFTVIGTVTMIPLLFKGKERVIVQPDKAVSVKQMVKYVAGNRYLLIFYLAVFVIGTTFFSQYIQIYLARHCFGNQDVASLIALISMVPLLLIGGILPSVTRKIDKYKLYITTNICAAGIGIILYFVGYGSLTVFYVLLFIQSVFTGANNILMFTFTPDCLEYGTYHTGERAEGVAASVQTFFSKLTGSISGPIAMLILAGFGFVSGEDAVQPQGVTDGIWMLYTLLPACGLILAIILLRFYRLRDRDVQVMAQYNQGKITRAEADRLLADRYGPAAELVNMVNAGGEQENGGQ